MSDTPSRRPPADDMLLERLLEDLAADRLPAAGEPADEGSPERRAYLETLGLVAASLEPVAPSEACRRRLMAAVAPPEAAAAPAAVVPLARPAAGGGLRRWALPLAASLAAVLAGLTGWQLAQLGSQRATIDQLSRRLAELETRADGARGMERQFGELRQRLELVTQSGVEVCTLKPMDGAPELSASSRGVLFVAPDHQHWYLAIEGLMPCSEGRSYQLWFVTADGPPVSAGTFDVVPGVRVELSSDRMPANTRAVSVTLEPAGGSEQPTGQRVLHGEDVMRIL